MANSFKQALIIPKETAVEAAAADVFTWIVEHPMRITDVSVVIVNAVVASDMTAGVASLDAVIAGAARAEKATLSMPEATAKGTEISAAESSGVAWQAFEVDEGDTLFFEHKTQAVDSGTATGEYWFILYYELIPDGQV